MTVIIDLNIHCPSHDMYTFTLLLYFMRALSNHSLTDGCLPTKNSWFYMIGIGQKIDNDRSTIVTIQYNLHWNGSTQLYIIQEYEVAVQSKTLHLLDMMVKVMVTMEEWDMNVTFVSFLWEKAKNVQWMCHHCNTPLFNVSIGKLQTFMGSILGQSWENWMH